MVPPPSPLLPATPGAQYVQQFISTALSQRGPESLPYTEDVKWLIRQHLVSLSEAYPSLHPKSSSFTHNDGRTVNLLQADGTIPITYQGAVYNLPASIWLLESYPRSPPAVYLSPTRDMVVKPNHPYVDRSGYVSAPYLQSWLFPSSNLVDFVRSLSHLFGQDPPLYTRQQLAPPPPRQFSSTPSPYSRIHSPAPTPQPRPSEDPGEVFQQNTISKLLETVNSDLSALRRTLEAEMEGLFATQAELRRREEELRGGLREMQDEEESLEQQLQLVFMNTDVLEGWVRDNESLARKIKVDEVFRPVDLPSMQLVETTAADIAVEDIIFSLDKAVKEGSLPFEMYLKSVRALSREQFFHRALGNKIRAADLQSQVSNVAARIARFIS